MKKLMSSMLVMAAMTSMISCSTEDVLDNGGQVDNGPVEIKLNAGVSATTKAAISNDFNKDFDVFFFRPADAATADWSTGTKIKATVSGQAGHAITFKNEAGDEIKQYYNEDAAKETHLVACHIDNSTIETDNLASGNISFTITGEQDIMATDGQNGSKTTQFTPFQFNHLLTQIDIVLKGDAAAQTAFGKIKSVKIKSVPTQLKLTLSSTAKIEAANADKNDITIYDDATGKELTTNTTDDPLASSVMIYNGGTSAYGTADNPLVLEVTSENGGTNGV